MARWLCIDYGRRRIGLAVGSDETTLAFPRPPIDTHNTDDPIAAILGAARVEKADALLIGWPLHPDGNPSPQTEAVQLFARSLMAHTSLPLYKHNEAYSTVIAKEKTAHFSLKRKKKNKGDLDSAAATVILQEFLELSATDREPMAL